MKCLKSLLLFLIVFTTPVFAEKETKTFLLGKNEYKYLEDNNLLISKAIQNAFGLPEKQNFYKLDIQQVDAWTSNIPELKYYPGSAKEGKKPFLRSSVLNSKENIIIKYRVTLDKGKSTINNSIADYLSDKDAFTLTVVVLANQKVLITEPSDKKAFLNIIDERSFAEKAFTNFFGENPKKINYNIAFDKTQACLVKNIITEVCEETFDGQSYDKFTERVTSPDYSSAYVLMDLHILRDRSKLNSAIEEVIIKETDGSEHLKFYFCIPADNTRGAKTSTTSPSTESFVSIKGRMLSVTDKTRPISNQVIELKNNGNQVISSQKTDNQGNFQFENIDPKANYSVELPNYTSIAKNEKVYLANSKNEFVKEFKKDKNNKFSYKILPADMHLLSSLNEEDIEMTFAKQKNLNTNEIIIHDFIYFNVNSSQLSNQSKPTLDKIASLINENMAYKVEIVSHTDCRGESSDNQKLSEKRSISVMAYLVSKNIDAKRLKPLGMGESKPLNNCIDGTNCLEEEYKMNRRTEFRFYK